MNFDMANLWEIYRLQQQIESKPKMHLCHLRIYSDGSGGLFQLSRRPLDYELMTSSLLGRDESWQDKSDRPDYEELVDWDNLEEAVVVLREYLETL